MRACHRAVHTPSAPAAAQEVDRSDRLARLLGHFGDVRHGGRADLRNIPRGEELRRQFYKLMQFND
jgi:hypothetical protein